MMITAQPDRTVHANCLNCGKRILLEFGVDVWIHAFNGKEDCP